MKRLITTLLILLSVTLYSPSANAQQSTSFAQEVGLRMLSFNDFNFMYKKQVKEDVYRRLRISTFNVATNMRNSLSLNMHFAFGSEKRTPLAERFEMVNGGEIIIQGATQLHTGLYQLPALGIGGVLGFNYFINDNILLGMEVIPSITTAYDSNEQRLSGLRVSANTESAALTMMYRF